MRHYITTPLCRLAVGLLFAVWSLAMAGPAMADNVLVPDEDYQYTHTTHMWTDANGNVFGFNVSESGLILYRFEVGVPGEPLSLTVPDVFILDGKEVNVMVIYAFAFSGCEELVSVTLPSTVFYVDYTAFNRCTNLADVYCPSFVPPFVASKSTSSVSHDPLTTRLHVPAASVSSYANALYWGDFSEVVALDEDLNRVSFCDAYTMTGLAGIAPEADLCLVNNRGLTKLNGIGPCAAHVDVNAPAPWQLGNFFMAQTTEYKMSYKDWSYDTFYEPAGFTTTLIPQSEMTATGDVTVQLDCRNRGWKFISFPFDVYMGDVRVSHNASWVIRRFNARERSVLGNSWQNVGLRETLKANTGYIIYTLTGNTEDVPMLTVKPTNATKQDLFTSADVAVPVVETYAVDPQDQNWNFVGNPYPAFYDMGQSDFTAPYTIWSRTVGANTYEVYSPIDDDHVLQPFEAFFLQSPSDVNSITFNAAGRMHAMPATEDPYYAPRRARALQNRQLYNIFLSDGQVSDRARIVVNPEAKESYELECDASKMMTTDAAVPQIYVIDGGIRYAIDERPLGSGLFTLGALFTQDGEYTLRLETRGEAQPVALTDRLTGQTFDLSQGEEYAFHAEAGTANDRFSLAIGDEATGFAEIKNEKLKIKNEEAVYNLSGRQMINGEFPKGIYVKHGKKMLVR